jgi:hypothetical protein
MGCLQSLQYLTVLYVDLVFKKILTATLNVTVLAACVVTTE